VADPQVLKGLARPGERLSDQFDLAVGCNGAVIFTYCQPWALTQRSLFEQSAAARTLREASSCAHRAAAAPRSRVVSPQ
jgi:hypothetical protein